MPKWIMMSKKKKRKDREQRRGVLTELAKEADALGLTPDEAYMLYGPDVRGLMLLAEQAREISRVLARGALSVDDVGRSLEAFRVANGFGDE